MAQVVYPGDVTPADVAAGRKFSSGPYYNAVGTSPYKYGSGDVFQYNEVRRTGTMLEMWRNNNPNVPAYSVAVDPLGKFLYAGTSDTTKTIRRLDPYTGAEIWANNIVPSNAVNSVQTDADGNVYIAQYVQGSGVRAVRKLNSTGAEVWANTEVDSAYDIAIDVYRNVYVAHNTNTRVVRKLNANGVEQWANTDVLSAYGVAVNSSGDTIVSTHNVSGGGKSVRALNASGGERWSNTAVSNARRVVLDESGNAYVTHSFTKPVRKLNSSGVEVWAVTDVANAFGITMDYLFRYVYVAHSNGSGTTFRIIDAIDGSVVYSNILVRNGYGVAIDRLNNIYLANNDALNSAPLRRVYFMTQFYKILK